MNRKRKYLPAAVLFILLPFLSVGPLHSSFQDPPGDDTLKLQYPFPEKQHFSFPDRSARYPLYLEGPENLQSDIIYDPETNSYIFSEKVGKMRIRPPAIMSFDEYREYDLQNSIREYWHQRSRGETPEMQTDFIPRIRIGGEAFDRVFGTNTIDIIPQGSAELIFGFQLSRLDNPTLSERLRRTPSFTFEEKIQMNVTGSIGDKMRLGINYNTEATFDFENKTKLEYSGKEDEIIKKIEAGNVTLPLSGSLITGSQSLFGLKTELQFGKLTVTNIFSQQKGETSVIEVEGGAQLNEFEVSADEYDANRHFFLSQYFKDRYDRALSNLPVIQSGIDITKIEVWVTNKSNNFENSRNIIAFMDLAETQRNIYATDYFSQMSGTSGLHPRNEINNLYEMMTTTYSQIRNISQATTALQPLAPGFMIGRDFGKIENARKLSTREYTLNEKLGYISLNTALNTDEVLGVAFEYTLNGKTYKVGELSSDGINAPQTLIVKLIKGTNLSPRIPTWELMMKNIYSIGAYQVNSNDFILEILYQDDKSGTAINYIPEGALGDQVLLRVLNLDNLNEQLDPYPDGVFDFISGVTVIPSNGRIIFPVREPFGSYLEQKIKDPEIAEKYVFNELYDSTITKARQAAEKNKFRISGTYQSSSSSEIMLNAMNVPQGSVKVTAGGRQLTENIDYTVDYTLGRVTIINQGLLQSGTPIKISLENQSLFAIQTKTLVGSHLDYRISEDFNIGATILNLTERPLTQKVNIGDEPISNTIWGLNGSYRSRSQLLTTLVDHIPLIDTREPSFVTVTGEFAHLVPGHSRAIKKEGTAYIDDFEGSETSIDMKNFAAWVLSSTPQGTFPEGSRTGHLSYGYNRAKLAWYVIDPLFLRNNSLTPGHIKSNPDLQSSHFVEEVFETDIFPKKENPTGVPTNINVLNLAFYPWEKGPYNYDLNIDPQGFLLNPRQRWGGIMREIQTNDFEAANVEYIEFWLMDPFVNDPDHTGGQLYFDLGEVSEDILRDSRKAFENGLPPGEEVTLVDTTVWGRVPLVQSLVNAFNNDLNARQYQDVGLDGLDDDDERSFFDSYLDSIRIMFGEASQAFLKAIGDPSNDNFHYFRGSDYDEKRLGILERYKQYNGLEGNSPTSEQSPESYPTTGSTLPNVEDINRDNTLNEGESYFEYQIDLNPSNLKVGSEFITDKVAVVSEFPNGDKSTVNWYQFRVPIYDYSNVVGSIQDFKSIRFMRMYLTGFEDSVILRFAKLDLVRGEWRKYNLPFTQGGEDLSSPEPADGSFEISAVNIEENAGKTPVNYILPPGIDRVIDPTNPQLRQLNEQSIVLKTEQLADGDARAAYKNIYMDVRQYKKLQMEVHAEALEGEPLNHGDLTAFIRLGSDYKGNFYEYEVPLQVTPPGRYENESNTDRRTVWPEENRFEISLDIFQQVKQSRNDAMRHSGSTVDITSVYSIFDEKGNRVSVKGNPNLSNVRTIMIGVRNPKATTNDLADDGMMKSGEIWMNELRLTDFNEKGGWAANARVTSKLADFGTVTFAGNTSKPGWGSIEKKVNERDKEEVIQYDLSTNLELGKFFSEKSGMTIPLYAGYSESIINPQYNPLDPDIPLKAALQNAETHEEKDSIKYYAQDYTQRKSLNFTNVRKNKMEGKPRVYDLANWSASYSYNEISSRNINTEHFVQRKYRAGLNYNFNSRPRNVRPFAKANLFNASYLRLIKDFNFYYFPSRISFRTDLNRFYGEKKLRNLNNPNLHIDTLVNKDFMWNRYYDIRYDLTRSLKLDFSATSRARIDEPLGPMNKSRSDYEAKKDSIISELLDFGRTTNYNHSINASYSLPINKIPLLNWVSSTVRYGTTYNWDAGPITPDTINLGNTIRNSNTRQGNAQLNLVNLYNKVPVLKRINQRFRGGRKPSEGKRTREVSYTRDNLVLRADRRRVISHNLKTRDIEVKMLDSGGNEIEGELEIVNENKVYFTSPQDYSRVRCEITGTRELGDHPLVIIGEYTARILMGVKNISVSYSENEGSIMPGYTPESEILGSSTAQNKFAPGWPFILGYQDDGFPAHAIDNNWLSRDSLINSPYIMTHTSNFNIRSTVEPLDGIRIDLTANRTYSENLNEYYIADVNGNFPDSTRSKQLTGNFSMSTITWGTAFEKVYSDENFASETFNKFKNHYRQIISERQARHLAEDGNHVPRLDSTGLYYEGFGPNSQEVLIPAFLAAYGERSPQTVSLSAVPSLSAILPNWRITFDGLSRVGFLKPLFRTISMSHTYRSSYNIGSFISNPFYTEGEEGFVHPDARDLDGNFIPEYEITSVSINEKFSPLINIDLTWVNNLTTRMEINKSRSLALSLANSQLAEMSSNEFVVGAGYRFNEVPLIFSTGSGERSLKSDLNVRMDFSIRNNRTIIRKLAEEGDQITAGQRIMKIETTLDYVLSDRFNLRFFFDRVVNKPFISLSYPTANTNVGFSIRFTLSQ